MDRTVKGTFNMSRFVKFLSNRKFYNQIGSRLNTLLLGGVISIGLFLRAYNIYISPLSFGKDIMWIWSRNLFSFSSLSEGFWHPPLYQIILIVVDRIYFSLGYLLGFFNSILDFETSRIIDVFSFILLARFVNVILGLITIIVIYLIGKKIQDKRTGLFASFLLACSYLHVDLCRNVNNDILVTLLISLAFFFILNIVFTGDPKSYVKSGFVIGIAIAAKYTGFLALFPFIVAHFLNKKASGLCDNKLYLGLSFVFLGFLAVFPAFLLEIGALFNNINWRLMSLLKEQANYYHINNGLLFLKIIYEENGFLISAFSIMGIIYCLLRLTNKINLILLSFPLFFYLIICFSGTTEEHWLLPVFPFLFLICAYFVVKLVDKIKLPHIRINSFILMGLVMAMVFSPVNRILQTEYALLGTDTEKSKNGWTKKFISNINVKDIAQQAVAGKNVWAKITGSESPFPIAARLPYMSTYDGPTVIISGKVVLKNVSNDSVKVYIHRGCYPERQPIIVIATILGSGKYSIKVPRNCGWINIRVAGGFVVKKNSLLPNIINVKDSNIDGIDLIVQ